MNGVERSWRTFLLLAAYCTALYWHGNNCYIEWNTDTRLNRGKHALLFSFNTYYYIEIKNYHSDMELVISIQSLLAN